MMYKTEKYVSSIGRAMKYILIGVVLFFGSRNRVYAQISRDEISGALIETESALKIMDGIDEESNLVEGYFNQGERIIIKSIMVDYALLVSQKGKGGFVKISSFANKGSWYTDDGLKSYKIKDNVRILNKDFFDNYISKMRDKYTIVVLQGFNNASDKMGLVVKNITEEKTIKYITLYGNEYNRVGDLIKNGNLGVGGKIKFTGPVSPDDEVRLTARPKDGSGYGCVEITQISIEFMNGITLAYRDKQIEYISKYSIGWNLKNECPYDD